jgi:uncharacterized OB-fold protein
MTLLERDPQAPQAWWGDLPVTSRYTFGLAGERFFRALKDEGKIMGSYCPRCEVTYVPGRIFCERCLAELDEWMDVGLQGEVHTYTLLYADVDGSPLDTPHLVAFIKIQDGGLVHFLGEIEPEEVFIGMLVEANLKLKPDRQGNIHDILYFRPV